MQTSIGRPIGVELEFASPGEDIDSIGEQLRSRLFRVPGAAPVFVNYRDSRGVNIPQAIQNSGQFWNVKFDGSCGLEITTPPLTNPLYDHLRIACEVAKEVGQVNRDCGTHVHHHLPMASLEELVQTVRLWWHYEPLLARLVADSRRNNRFCRLYTMEYSSRDFTNYLEQARTPQFFCDSFPRYHSLNFTHWWRTSRVEVRLHHGTLNPRRIWSWAHFTQHLLNAGSRVSMNDLLPSTNFDNPAARLDEVVSLLGETSTRRERRYFRRMLAERFVKYNTVTDEQRHALQGV